MLDPYDPENRPLVTRLQRARTQAFFAVLSERLAARWWRIAVWALLFAGLWLLEIPAILGQVASVSAFIIFLTGLCYFFHRDVRFFSLPRRKDTDRRIEDASHLNHRPLDALEDRLANPQKEESKSLWQTSKNNALALLKNLRPVIPRSILAKDDPYAIRFGIILFSGLGLFIAGQDWQARIGNGLTPFNARGGKVTSEKIRLVITPPAYTGLAPLILNTGSSHAIKIPDGSMIKATVHGGFGQPELIADGTAIPFEIAGDDNYILEMSIPKGSSLKITQLYVPRASWNYTVVTDKPPEIAMKDGIEVAQEGAARFPMMLKDDYGVKTLSMNLELDSGIAQPPIGKTVSETRSIMSPGGAAIEAQPVYDLSSHPWAGLPVRITFTAEDAMAQKASPAPVQMILPERRFAHPVAASLVNLRKKLIMEPLEHYESIRAQLESLIIHPQAFEYDFVVAMALRSASSRLYWSGPSMETAESVVGLLWDTALRIEDGNFSIATRDLRNAQAELENALRNPSTSNEEIARLMQNLRSAMAEYFMELQREIQKRVAKGEDIPLVPAEMLSKMISPDELGALLDQLEAQMLSGDRQGAQQMLSQLQNMMDMLNPSTAQMPKDIQAMIQGMKEIQKLIDRQQALLDKTIDKANRHNQPGDIIIRDFGQALPHDMDRMKSWGLKDMPPPPQASPTPLETPVTDMKEHLTEQETLRHQLGEIMTNAGVAMGKIPENFGKAEIEMRGSSRALDENDASVSVVHQEEVLKQLQESQKQLSQSLAQRLEQMTGMALGGGFKYDPLGRPYGGQGDGDQLFPGSRVKIPDEAERKKAQEILRLLQKRSGELDRPEEELDYYRRLLRQF